MMKKKYINNKRDQILRKSLRYKLLSVFMIFITSFFLLVANLAHAEPVKHYYTFLAKSDNQGKIKAAPILHWNQRINFPKGEYYLHVLIKPEGVANQNSSWDSYTLSFNMIDEMINGKKNGLKAKAVLNLNSNIALLENNIAGKLGGLAKGLFKGQLSLPNVLRRLMLTPEDIKNHVNKEAEKSIKIHVINKISASSLSKKSLNEIWTFWNPDINTTPEDQSIIDSLSMLEKSIEDAITKEVGFYYSKDPEFKKKIATQKHVQFLRYFSTFITGLKEGYQQLLDKKHKDNKADVALDRITNKKIGREKGDEVVSTSILWFLLFLVTLGAIFFGVKTYFDNKKASDSLDRDEERDINNNTMTCDDKRKDRAYRIESREKISILEGKISELEKGVRFHHQQITNIQNNNRVDTSIPISQQRNPIGLNLKSPEVLENIARLISSDSQAMEVLFSSNILKKQFDELVVNRVHRVLQDRKNEPEVRGKDATSRKISQSAVSKEVKSLQTSADVKMKLFYSRLTENSGIRELNEERFKNSYDRLDLLAERLQGWLKPNLSPNLYIPIDDIVKEYTDGKIQLEIPKIGDKFSSGRHDLQASEGVEMRGSGGTISKVIRPGVKYNETIISRAQVVIRT